MIQNAWEHCLRWIYPTRCGICEQVLDHSLSLCSKCDESLPRLEKPFCECCGEMFDGAIETHFQCPNCHGIPFSFQFARPAMTTHPQTLHLIHQLKYEKKIHLADTLAYLASFAFEDPRLQLAYQEQWVLVPVPLHHQRQRHRFFNQSEEIAISLSKRLKLPWLNALRRTRPTISQTKLNRSERLRNLNQSFEWRSQRAKSILSQASGIILIDDVLTTGSTLHACAQILKSTKPPHLVAVTVMRG